MGYKVLVKNRHYSRLTVIGFEFELPGKLGTVSSILSEICRMRPPPAFLQPAPCQRSRNPENAQQTVFVLCAAGMCSYISAEAHVTLAWGRRNRRPHRQDTDAESSLTSDLLELQRTQVTRVEHKPTHQSGRIAAHGACSSLANIQTSCAPGCLKGHNSCQASNSTAQREHSRD